MQIEVSKYKLKKNIIELFKMIAIAVVLAFLITRVTVKTVVHGRSMDPTLHDGEQYFLNKLAYSFSPPERNDFIVFKPEYGNKEIDTFYIKRIIAIEGDTIYIENNKVYLNNAELHEPYIKEQMITEDLEEITLKVGEVFVMGDNRNNSMDSRKLGPIKIDSIYGKLITIKNKF